MSDFNPSTYILVTSGSEEGEDLQKLNKKLLELFLIMLKIDMVKILNLVLGSKVMNEGVTLENVKDVHILDVHYNLG